VSEKLTHSLETATRKKIDLILNNLGWNTDESNKDCNVFTERAKTVEQDKKFGGDDPDYVLYKSGTDEPIAIIEAKRKGQDVDEAITDAEKKYARPLGVKIIFAYDGAFFRSWHTEAKKELLIDGITVTQLVPEKKLLRFLDEGYGISETSPKIKHSRAELISIFKWANGLLRKEGLREGIERFTEFANLLFLKLISELELEREKEGEPPVLPPQYLWKTFCDLDPTLMLNYINDTILPYLVDRYNHSGDVFQSKLVIKNPKTLKQIVDRLSAINLMDAESDVKGDAFEYFLKDSITVGNDLGEYFTPRHLVSLMTDLLEPKFGEKIYDPTCGTGGFLIAAFNYIRKRCAKTKDNYKTLRESTVYGREITNTARIAKMNMILTGDGHTNIEQLDSIKNPVIDQYNVVMANIPYGQSTDYGEYYPIPSNSGDAVFLEHIIMALVPGGRAAVVIPEGLLFRPGPEYHVREYLLKQCNVIAIISLPIGIFRPYARMNKTDIIIFEKDPNQDKPKGTQSIWFYNLEYDGFDLHSDSRPEVEPNDIPDLLDKWSEKVESAKSWSATIKQIEERNFDLVAKTYGSETSYTSTYPLVPFSEIMTENKETITIDDKTEYARVRVQLHGRGVVVRDHLVGKKIKTKEQKLTRANQFIVAEIDAKLGGFGVVPKGLEKSIVSSHYFLFDLDTSKILPEYFDFVIRLGPYAAMIKPFVKGTTNYAAIRPKHILQLTIPLPPIKKQKEIVDSIKKKYAHLDELEKAKVDTTHDIQGTIGHLFQETNRP
jgi:type I restriction enzyme M protein